MRASLVRRITSCLLVLVAGVAGSERAVAQSVTPIRFDDQAPLAAASVTDDVQRLDARDTSGDRLLIALYSIEWPVTELTRINQ